MGQCQSDKKKEYQEPPVAKARLQHPQKAAVFPRQQQHVQRQPPPRILYVKIWGDAHSKCSGRYDLVPEGAAAVWRNGDLRMYTDSGGFWIIGSESEMSTGVGWFATESPHRGKNPEDKSLTWAYVAKGGHKKGWQPSAPMSISTSQPVSAFTMISGGASKATYASFSTALKTHPEILGELGIPSSPGNLPEYFKSMCVRSTGYITEASLAAYSSYRKLFQSIDTRNLNKISAWDLERALTSNPSLQKTLGIKPNLSLSFIRQIDATGRGWGTMLQFVTFLQSGGVTQAQNKRHGSAAASDRIVAAVTRENQRVTLSELTAVLEADREAQLELGWPAHQTSVIFHILQGNNRGYVMIQDLKVFLELTTLFNQIDLTRDGFIDAHEFGTALGKDLVLQRALATNAVDAQIVFSKIDLGRHGSVSFVEFYRFYKKYLADLKMSPAVKNNNSNNNNNNQPPRYANQEYAYQVKNKLGEGSYGIVFLVKRAYDGLNLIMKKPKLSSGFNMDDVRREAELLQKVKHPHIIRFVEAFKNTSGALIIITEFADGGDLRKKIRTFPRGIPQQQTMVWFSEICEAVQYLHNRHILHRDLKTDNIFLTAGGSVKLGDLGLAKQLKLDYRTHEAVTHTVFRGAKGAPSNMSPEQVRGETHGTPIDIWALGCILYEMCTCKPCFTSPEAALRCSGEPPSDTPRFCHAIVKECLTPSQYRRPDIQRIIGLIDERYKDAQGCMATHLTDRKHRDGGGGGGGGHGGGGLMHPNMMHR